MINKLLGIPGVASEHGREVDHMLEMVHWLMVVLTIGWTLFFFYCLWRFYRKRNPKADYYGVKSHGSTHIEIGVVIIEAILLLGFAFPLWAKRAGTEAFPTGPDVVELRAVAEQFKWTFHYPGPDGKFGTTDATLIDGNNPLGINADDPNSSDDFISSELVLADERDCIIEITSKDVIHNLALKPMRMAQDAIPGMVAHVWFRPNKTGEWQIICGQLCGAGHATMIGTLIVKKSDEYDAWFKELTPKVKEAGPKEG